MADIILPPNVKQDPNTGLYIITNAQGKTVRVNADNQAQLNQYVNSVATGVPATVTTTDPNTGNPRTRTFDSNAIISEKEAINRQNELLTAGKRQAGVIGNRDGSYQDFKTGETITKEQAEAKIKAAGLPPETLVAVTPKNSPAYAAAQASINQTATGPSNIPPAETQQPSQSGGGNSTSAEVTASVPGGAPAPAAVAVPRVPDPAIAPVVNAEANAKIAAIEAQRDKNSQELRDLRQKSIDLPDGPERDAVLAQRAALSAEQKTLAREVQLASNQSPATGQFEGVDRNSGEYRYKNPVTGESFLSNTAPTSEQQQQSGQTAPIPAVPPLASESRPETSPAEVQTAAAVPALVDNVAPEDVPANQDSGLLTPEQSIARAQSSPPPVDAATFNANTNAGVLGAIGVPESAPAPVNPATDPGVKGPFGGAASNAAAAQNPEAAAAAYQQEQANQAAAMKLKAQQEAAVQAQFQSPAAGDWRVRLRLAPNATYLYKDKNVAAGILAPLAASNGVVFPYMPTIQTTYNADYSDTALTHSNYKGYFYNSSYVGDVSITGTFTAQDTAEANYLLAVIHFFRSVTKMFYGAKDPLRGAPPPLVYLIGLGQYQFNNQPCVVKTFNYSMPNDCDYIRTKPNNYNTNLGGRSPKPQASSNPISSVISRLKNSALEPGAVPAVPAQGLLEMQSVTNIADATYVPTKCEIQLTLMPIQTRSQQSQQFNMENFANGNLLKGGFW